MTDEYDWSAALMDKIPFKIILTAQDKINQYSKGITLLLDILQHPEALVTDESTLRDFSPDGVTMRILGNTYKRILNVDEELWQLAKELEEMDDPR